MKYMLDTNICVSLINKRPPRVLEHFSRHTLGEIGVSSITVAELAYGVSKSGSSRNQAALDAFLMPLAVAEFNQDAAWKSGEIRAVLEANGKAIGPYDLLIAGHARSLGCTLVTNNQREFQRVPGLKTDNWAA